MAARLDISTLRIDEDPLQKFEDNLRVSLDKLKADSTCQFQLDVAKYSNYTKSRISCWSTLGSCTQAISKECTKLSLAFSKPPLPSTKDTEALVNGLEGVLSAVFETYKALSQQEGALLLNGLKAYIIDLTKALLEFVVSIRCDKKDELLKTVGIVWEHCEAFGLLSKDNKELALKETQSSFGLVNDAIAESEEYYQEWQESQNDVMANEKDSASDKLQEQHILASIGLAKVAKSLLKKITKCFGKNAQTDDVSKVNELDSITQTIKLLSPSVDDLFCGIYSESLTETHNEGLKLASLVEKLLQQCRSSHFCLDEDASWLDFLSQALDHNLKKLTTTAELNT